MARVQERIVREIREMDQERQLRLGRIGRRLVHHDEIVNLLDDDDDDDEETDDGDD